ncbi:hypothetical protein [Mycobacterium szulgai]|uniref:hypothetical protein n=1 Tax=Mycobacterium szulgai TaxID=1787 RepID=UPI00111C4C39|nr:hypothetical protein [Mycobacterium szulgai]
MWINRREMPANGVFDSSDRRFSKSNVPGSKRTAELVVAPKDIPHQCGMSGESQACFYRIVVECMRFPESTCAAVVRHRLIIDATATAWQSEYTECAARQT